MSFLNPVLCVKSRVANVVGLPGQYDNDHGLKQLRASIAVCRHFLEDLAQLNVRNALQHVEKLFALSCERNALKLYREKAIDTFGALPSLDLLPPAFRSQRHPRMVGVLAAKRSRRPR